MHQPGPQGVDARIGLLWFRRDLRLADDPAWAAATVDHERLTALYVLDHAEARRRALAAYDDVRHAAAELP